MSVDEIRRLAEEVGSGETSNADLSIAEALLDYAAMVERCEKARRKLVAMTNMNSPTWSFDGHVEALNDIDKIDYILKGSTVTDGK